MKIYMTRVMMMRIERFRKIKGDGEPFWTEFYRDVPVEYKLETSWNVIDGRYQYLEERKDDLIRGFNLTYGRYEINGVTYQDFKDHLDELLFNNGKLLNDTVGLMQGRLYQAYDDELLTVSAKTESGTSSTDEDTTSTSKDSLVDVPKDNPTDDKDTERRKGELTSGRGTVVDYETVNSGYTEERTAYGFDRPFEIVNKFIGEGKSINDVFNETFEDCFIYGEAWYVW